MFRFIRRLMSPRPIALQMPPGKPCLELLEDRAMLSNTVSVIIGDNDGYGIGVADNGSLPFLFPVVDNRSLTEQVASDGAQITDIYSFAPNSINLKFPFSGMLASGSWTVDMGDFQPFQFGHINAYYNGVLQPDLLSFQDGFQNSRVRTFSLNSAALANANAVGEFVLTIERNNSVDWIAFDFFRFDGVKGNPNATRDIELTFPLRNWSPYTIPVSSVFDHSQPDNRPDNMVMPFTGELATIQVSREVEEPVLSKGKELFSYTRPGGFPLLASALNYTGTGSGPSVLNYDGHTGYDYVVEKGTAVFAAADGIARLGNADLGEVVVQHKNGFSTHYLHLDTRLITPGEMVVGGQTLIGRVGSKGAGNQVHLHLTVMKDGKRVDPYGWIGPGSSQYDVGNLWANTLSVTTNGVETATLTDIEIPRYLSVFATVDGSRIEADKEIIMPFPVWNGSLTFGFDSFDSLKRLDPILMLIVTPLEPRAGEQYIGMAI